MQSSGHPATKEADRVLHRYRNGVLVGSIPVRGAIQGVSKKGNRTLQSCSAFIVQSTEIILSQAERPGF